MLNFKVVYRELRQPILRTLMIVGAVTGLTIMATLFNEHFRQVQLDSEQSLRGTVLSYRNALDDKHILQTQAARFEALREEGFVGPEPRLRWVEDVREIAERVDLVAIKYELGAREAHASGMASTTYQLYASPMKLELHLRHEGDLLTFLNLLEGRRGGLFELASCSLDRLNQAGETDGANVKADCRLLWYSLDTPQIISEDI